MKLLLISIFLLSLSSCANKQRTLSSVALNKTNYCLYSQTTKERICSTEGIATGAIPKNDLHRFKFDKNNTDYCVYLEKTNETLCSDKIESPDSIPTKNFNMFDYCDPSSPCMKRCMRDLELDPAYRDGLFDIFRCHSICLNTD